MAYAGFAQYHGQAANAHRPTVAQQCCVAARRCLHDAAPGEGEFPPGPVDDPDVPNQKR